MWLLILATSVAPCVSANSLEVDTPLSREGYFVLSWSFSSSPSSPVLQQASSPDFRNSIDREIESEGSLTITGQEDGQYYFRLVDGPNSLTEPLLVTVEHHQLSRAGFFFSLGLILFTVLVVLILQGSKREGTADV
ncbi:MAG: hypothetical protein RL839_01330 [Gammaproteobacteria bacterium]